MAKKLSITVFGTLYHVGVLHLTPDAMRVGIGAYGKKEWSAILSDVALDLGTKNLSREVVHTIGQPLERVHFQSGVAMDGHPFGFEVFLGNDFQAVSMVEAQNEVVRPSRLVRRLGPDHALGVFWATMEGGVQYRWGEADEVKQEDLVLAYDTLSPLLALKHNFNLVREVTWQGKKGRRKALDFGTGIQSRNMVFHRGK